VSSGGTVSSPPGTSSCGPWDHAANMSTPEGVADLGTVDVRDGVLWNLLYRICEPDTLQYLWVPDIDPEDLAHAAFEEVQRLVAPPAIQLFPPESTSGIVNLETWLAVEPMTDVSVTAGPLPPDGITATTTATPVLVEWDTGDPKTDLIRCEPWGAPPSRDAAITGDAPCGWTPSYPSTPEFGIGGGSFDGSITVVWHVTWSANTGEGGDLGEIRTTTPVSYTVREIQTVGISG
ncbi:MAG: hypothetical protein AB7K08_15200, partial [Microbacteriaceae bacterium]